MAVQSYQELSERHSANPGLLSHLKLATDAGNFVSHATFALPFIPLTYFSSLGLSLATIVKTAASMKHVGAVTPVDNDDVRSYRGEFNQAAARFLKRQAFSAAFNAVSMPLYGFGWLSALGDSEPGAIVGIGGGILMAAAGMVTGWFAYKETRKMSVYESAIKNAQYQQAAQQQVPNPAP